MKFTEYLLFAALLIPTVAVVAAAAISLAGPETDVLASQAYLGELAAEYQLPREPEDQP
jgi:hypothetical protein